MADDAHSLFSASGSDAWGAPDGCPGKPALEHGRKTTSHYADEGTAAHDIANRVLDARIKGFDHTADRWLGTKVEVERWDGQAKRKSKRVFVVDEEMVDGVDAYVDRVMLFATDPDAVIQAEAKSYYHEFLGVPKALAWGTADATTILFNQPRLIWEGREFPPGDELQVHDLKYGKGVAVNADTRQLKCYGAGRMWEWDHIANFTRVRLVIHQPRLDHVDELVITPDELRKAVVAMRPAVPRVLEAKELADALRAEGQSDMQVGEALDRRGFLNVNEKGCRFCDAKAICPAMIREVGEALTGRSGVTADDFEDLTIDARPEVREYGGNYLQAAFRRAGLIEEWLKAVRAEIDHRILNKGESFDGLKVVAGRRGKRSWDNPAALQLTLQGVPAPVRALLYDQRLKTPAQAEAALKTSPLTWAKLQKHIDQAEGAPSVVPITDKRPAISHKALAEEFEDLTQEPDQPAPRGVGAGRDQHPFR